MLTLASGTVCDKWQILKKSDPRGAGARPELDAVALALASARS